MNWINQLNQSIEYIENNLDKSIHMREISRIAGCSPYHYQRLFSLVAEITLAEGKIFDCNLSNLEIYDCRLDGMKVNGIDINSLL